MDKEEIREILEDVIEELDILGDKLVAVKEDIEDVKRQWEGDESSKETNNKWTTL